MKAIVPCLAQYTTVSMRLALGSTFLAAVTDRCGLWGPPGTRNVAWGTFDHFLAYAAQLNPSLPTPWLPALGWGVTLAEVTCSLALIVGFQTRKVAVGSGLLLGGVRARHDPGLRRQGAVQCFGIFGRGRGLPAGHTWP